MSKGPVRPMHGAGGSSPATGDMTGRRRHQAAYRMFAGILCFQSPSGGRGLIPAQDTTAVPPSIASTKTKLREAMRMKITKVDAF
jgi:hypothetical protein